MGTSACVHVKRRWRACLARWDRALPETAGTSSPSPTEANDKNMVFIELPITRILPLALPPLRSKSRQPASSGRGKENNTTQHNCAPTLKLLHQRRYCFSSGTFTHTFKNTAKLVSAVSPCSEASPRLALKATVIQKVCCQARDCVRGQQLASSGSGPNHASSRCQGRSQAHQHGKGCYTITSDVWTLSIAAMGAVFLQGFIQEQQHQPGLALLPCCSRSPVCLLARMQPHKQQAWALLLLLVS